MNPQYHEPTTQLAFAVMGTEQDFVLRERLGEGGFGVVYRAHQPQLDREVAVKLIH